MAGKYTNLRGTLPAFEEAPEYQTRIDAEKKRILGGADDSAGANVPRIAALFIETRKEVKEIEECPGRDCAERLDQIDDVWCLFCLNVRKTALSQILADELRGGEEEQVKLSSGATVYLKDSPMPKVDDKDKLMTWIDEHDMAALLSLNHMTLKGLCTERLQAGEEVPAGVSVQMKTEAMVREPQRRRA